MHAPGYPTPDYRGEAILWLSVIKKTDRLLFHFSAVPLEPTNVEIFGIDSDELSVRWSPSEDADSFEIEKYVVQRRKFGEELYTNASQLASDDKTQYTIRIQPLDPETTYMIRVGAVNKYGDNFNDETAHKTHASRKSRFYSVFIFSCLFMWIAWEFRELSP